MNTALLIVASGIIFPIKFIHDTPNSNINKLIVVGTDPAIDCGYLLRNRYHTIVTLELNLHLRAEGRKILNV